jgi:hypothetical protein
VPEQLFDAETIDKKDMKQLGESLRILWEKARKVSDVVLQLKAENKELQDRLSSLEMKERHWAEDIQSRERELNDIRAQLSEAQSNGKTFFSKEESEALKLRLKELILKINSRL